MKKRARERRRVYLLWLFRAKGKHQQAARRKVPTQTEKACEFPPFPTVQRGPHLAATLFFLSLSLYQHNQQTNCRLCLTNICISVEAPMRQRLSSLTSLTCLPQVSPITFSKIINRLLTGFKYLYDMHFPQLQIYFKENKQIKQWNAVKSKSYCIMHASETCIVR